MESMFLPGRKDPLVPSFKLPLPGHINILSSETVVEAEGKQYKIICEQNKDPIMHCPDGSTKVLESYYR